MRAGYSTSSFFAYSSVISEESKLMAAAAASLGCVMLCLLEPETVGSTMK